MSGFRRVDRGRWHDYSLDGRKLPGVTTIINKAVPKPALIDWSSRVAAEWAVDHIDVLERLGRDAAVDTIKTESRRRNDAAKMRGTDVHALAQRVAEGQEVHVPDDLVGYLDAYLTFWHDWHVEPIVVEASCVNRRWYYAGTFDLLARLAGREIPDMIDVKTGERVYRETCLQIAAYRHAEHWLDSAGVEQPMPATGGGYALLLDPGGTYELVPVESGDEMFAVFLHAAYVAAFVDRKGDDDPVGLPLAPPAPAIAS